MAEMDRSLGALAANLLPAGPPVRGGKPPRRWAGPVPRSRASTRRQSLGTSLVLSDNPLAGAAGIGGFPVGEGGIPWPPSGGTVATRRAVPREAQVIATVPRVTLLLIEGGSLARERVTTRARLPLVTWARLCRRRLLRIPSRRLGPTGLPIA
jgi:hypothetical protein